MKTIVFLSLLLASVAAVPAAAADDVCQNAVAADACVVNQSDSRFTSRGVYVFGADGTFAGVSQNEGSGFFGDTWTADAFAYSPTAGDRFVVLVLALNDKHPTDGTYEEGGLYVGTWSWTDPLAADAWVGFFDSDWDGETDGIEAGSGLLP